MNGQIAELINVTHDVSWLSWGVQYFFLIGLSYGAFFLTVPAFVLGRKRWEGVGRVALLTALTCGIAAPIALVADLHQPGRFYHFYLHPTPGSWMSWGAFFLPAYVTGLVVYAWLILRPGLAAAAAGRAGVVAAVSRALAFGGRESRAAIRVLGLTTAAAALAVALYTGVEMAAVASRPLWHSPFMPLLYLSTALASAAGLTLVLNRIFNDGDADIRRKLGMIVALSSMLTVLLAAAWLLAGLTGLSASGAAALRLATQYNPVLFTLLWLGLGTVAPLLLVRRMPLPAAALAVAGAWWLRWSMFIDGQRIPKTGAGFFPYELPAGSEGIAGLLGTFGLWVLLVLAVTTFLPWRGDAAPARR